MNQALVDRDQQEIQEALAAIGGSTTLPIEEQPVIKEAQAKLEQARLNLDYTKVTAKITGYITRRQVEVGNWVQPGQPLMMLVPLATHQLWVQANYKETELTHVYIGQPAAVEVDTYPGSNSGAGWTPSWPAPARPFRCCRRKTPPATGSRWCSASR